MLLLSLPLAAVLPRTLLVVASRALRAASMLLETDAASKPAADSSQASWLPGMRRACNDASSRCIAGGWLAKLEKHAVSAEAGPSKKSFTPGKGIVSE
jgi:hypothetical protein